MRYLPRKQTLRFHDTWRIIEDVLINAVRKSKVIYSEAKGSKCAYSLDQLRAFGNDLADWKSSPPLPELKNPTFLSTKYTQSDINILADYGLENLTTKDIMPLLQALVWSPSWNSRFYQARDEHWHSLVARWILKAWNDTTGNWRNILKRLPLLPLSSGNFLTPAHSKLRIYFPDINGIPIPCDLSLIILDQEAATNPDCRRLYEALGVVTCDFTAVRTLILNKHSTWASSPRAGPTISLHTSIGHLQFMYQSNSDAIDNRPFTAVVFDQDGNAKIPRQERVYLPGISEWSIEKRLFPLRNLPGYSEIKSGISILHEAYMKDLPKRSTGYTGAWMEFLSTVVQLEPSLVQIERLPGTARDVDFALTPEWSFVKDHRPDWFISRLKTEFCSSPSITDRSLSPFNTTAIRNITLECTNGFTKPLCQSFLPLPSLLFQCGNWFHGDPIAILPFLKLEKPLTEADEEKDAAWLRFAATYGISTTTNLPFMLTVLEAVMHEDALLKEGVKRTVAHLYLKIFEQCNASTEGKGNEGPLFLVR